MTLFSRCGRVIAAAALAGLLSCAGGPKPTMVQAALDVQPTVNPDSRGRPSPIVIRLYALKSLGAFNSAAFFSLFEKDKDTLGSELVDSEEFQLMPGKSARSRRNSSRKPVTWPCSPPSATPSAPSGAPHLRSRRRRRSSCKSAWRTTRSASRRGVDGTPRGHI